MSGSPGGTSRDDRNGRRAQLRRRGPDRSREAAPPVPEEQSWRLRAGRLGLLELAQSSTPRFGFLVHGRSPGSADVPPSRDAPYPPQQLASRVFNVDEWGDPLAAFEQIACLGPDEPEGPLGRHSALSGDARRGCPSDERQLVNQPMARSGANATPDRARSRCHGDGRASVAASWVCRVVGLGRHWALPERIGASRLKPQIVQ